MANFTGFDDVATSGLNPANPVLTLSVGSTNTSYTPRLSNSPFSFSTAFTYGTPLNFSASISVAAQAPFLMMNAAAFFDVEGKVTFTGFTVENLNGAPIPGTMTFAPEPSFFLLTGLVLLTALMIHTHLKGRHTSRNRDQPSNPAVVPLCK